MKVFTYASSARKLMLEVILTIIIIYDFILSVLGLYNEGFIMALTLVSITFIGNGVYNLLTHPFSVKEKAIDSRKGYNG